MKSKFFVNIFVFLFIFIVQIVFSYGIELETTFFNVGQGNCTVLGFKELEKNTPRRVLLVDAGSKEYDKERAGCDAPQQKKNIAKKIDAFFSEREKNFLTVVLSHGDEDHYNWVPDIIKNLSKKDVEINFICGGEAEHYGNLFVDKKTNKTTKNAIFKSYMDEKKVNFSKYFENDFPKIDFLPGTCKILAAIKNSDDKNDLSIVLKIKYAGKSLLLTGDATDKTINSIKRYSVVPLKSSETVKNLKSKELGVFSKDNKLYCKTRKKNEIEIPVNDNPGLGVKNDIFQSFLNKKATSNDKNTLLQYLLSKNYIQKVTLIQLSHHGASDKCNSNSFIEEFFSQASVISAGIYKNMWHPKKVVIERIASKLQSLQKENPQFHLIRYYADDGLPTHKKYELTPSNDNFYPLGSITTPPKESGYILARTSLLLFTTSTNGTVSFSFKEGEEKNSLAYPKIEYNTLTTFKELQSTLKKYSGGLSSLNLCNLNINDNELEEFINVLPKNLVSLSLVNNKLTDPAPIIKLIEDRKNLGELALKGNKFNNSNQITLTWNNRGLDL